MTPDICIYHANCMDGFTAAWVVKRRFPDVQLIAAAYGDEPPRDIEDKHVLIVDFSYPAALLRPMITALHAGTVTVLDHHKTAEADLRPYNRPLPFVEPKLDGGGLRAHFNMNKSGARLAWEFCHGDEEVPPIVAYTEDRDLWLWKLHLSREINTALGSYDQHLDTWDWLDRQVGNSMAHPNGALLVWEGKAILRQRDKDIAALIGTTRRKMVIGGHNVDVCNAPFYLASDVGNQLAQGAWFGATYFDGPDGRIFSLRSEEEGADVSAIAKGYGGGGHKHAAGFKMPRGWEGTMPPQTSAAEQMRLAIGHIEHMSAWIGDRQQGYSFESLGEDMPGIKAALEALERGSN